MGSQAVPMEQRPRCYQGVRRKVQAFRRTITVALFNFNVFPGVYTLDVPTINEPTKACELYNKKWPDNGKGGFSREFMRKVDSKYNGEIMLAPGEILTCSWSPEPSP